MYANMEAGLMYGKAITGLDDVNEMSRLSDVYKDNAYYFATRASEIHFKQPMKQLRLLLAMR